MYGWYDVVMNPVRNYERTYIGISCGQYIYSNNRVGCGPGVRVLFLTG